MNRLNYQNHFPMSYSFTEISKVQLLKIESLWNADENRKIISQLEELIKARFYDFIIELKSTPYGQHSAAANNNFINSTGLSFLISILTRARTAGGDVVLYGISESTHQLLALTKLNKTFSTFNALEEALAHFLNAKV
jgi:anti-sigma B factor antagonist